MLATQRFAFLRASGDIKALKSTAVFMARLALLGALPLPLVFLFFGYTLIERVFGASFLPAITPIFLLFLGQIVNASFGMASTLLIMNGREAKVIQFTLLAVVFNAFLSWLLIPTWGAIGAATANLFSGAIWNLLIWFYLRRSLYLDTSVLGLHEKLIT
jgi:O-antigen/teichoic acid export membrane protein